MIRSCSNTGSQQWGRLSACAGLPVAPPRLPQPRQYGAESSVRTGSPPHSARYFARLSSLLFLLAASLPGATADWIWSGRYVITMDPQRRVIENGAVAIQGRKIVAVGVRAEI